MFDLKFQQPTHHALDLLNAWIAKLNNFTAIEANNVIMLFIAV